jgi:hypothetical protein
MDAGGAADESAGLRTAKSCGPDAPTLASSSRSDPRNDGGKQARSPGRARRKPLKPLRAGMPGDPGATVVTNARAFYPPRAAAGASGTRHSPRPLFRGGVFLHNSGASRREIGEVCEATSVQGANGYCHCAPPPRWLLMTARAIRSAHLTIFWHCGLPHFSFRTGTGARPRQPTVNGFGRELGSKRVWQC